MNACGSEKNKGHDETIFGLYQLGSSKNIRMQLNSDSTVILDISNTRLQKQAAIAPVHKEGRFSLRNDSIYFTWDNGTFQKTRFEKDGNTYFFYIGSTRYQKKPAKN